MKHRGPNNRHNPCYVARPEKPAFREGGPCERLVAPNSMNKLAEEIGFIVHLTRMRHNLTLQQASLQLGVSNQGFHKYETGATAISAPLLYKLAEMFDVPYDEFFPYKPHASFPVAEEALSTPPEPAAAEAAPSDEWTIHANFLPAVVYVDPRLREKE